MGEPGKVFFWLSPFHFQLDFPTSLPLVQFSLWVQHPHKSSPGTTGSRPPASVLSHLPSSHLPSPSPQYILWLQTHRTSYPLECSLRSQFLTQRKSFLVYCSFPNSKVSPGGSDDKESVCNAGVAETRVGKIPWRREWQPILVFLPGERHGQKNLTDDSLWGPKESDMIERQCTTSPLPRPEFLSRRISCFLLGVPIVLYHKQGTSHVALL